MLFIKREKAATSTHGYIPGAYERAVTIASRDYAQGEMNVTEFRRMLADLRQVFNREPS